MPSKYNISKKSLRKWLFKLPSSSLKLSRLHILVQNLNIMIIVQSRMVHFYAWSIWQFMTTFSKKKKHKLIEMKFETWWKFGQKTFKKIIFLCYTIGVQTGRVFFGAYCIQHIETNQFQNINLLCIVTDGCWVGSSKILKWGLVKLSKMVNMKHKPNYMLPLSNSDLCWGPL